MYKNGNAKLMHCRIYFHSKGFPTYLIIHREERFQLWVQMAGGQFKSMAGGLLFLNLCMYIIVSAIGGWAINFAINYGFVIGPGLQLPAHFSPIYFPMGNAATGFFVMFALIAGVVGAASALAGINHIRTWDIDSLPAASSSAIIAWTLTLLAMGLACKEIELRMRNASLRTMEAFLIILSATQFFYILAIHGGAQPSRIRR